MYRLAQLLALCVPLSVAPLTAAQEMNADPWGGLVDGPYPVGFWVDDIEIASGAAEPTELPRRLRVFSWYPAAVDGGEPMRYGDYYRAQGGVGDLELRERLLEDMTRPPGASLALAGEVADWRVAAHRGAQRRDGAFPLVLWSARDSIPHMQAALNEYLASWGYVVSFAWPLEAVPKLPWQGATPEESQRAVEVHVALMRRLVSHPRHARATDTSRIAVLSWSYGGETAFEFARTETRVAISIGLDATLVSGWILRPDALADASPDGLAGPVVLLRNGRPRLDAPDSRGAPELLRRVRDGWQVRFPLLSHGNFNVPGGLIPGLLGLDEISHWARGGEVAVTGYRAVCRAVRHFLDGALPRPSVQNGQSDWLAGFPPGFVEVVAVGPNRGPYALDGQTTFRIEIAADDEGTPIKIVGHYVSGSSDQSPRDPPSRDAADGG